MKIADKVKIEFSKQHMGVYQWRITALAGEEELSSCVLSSRQETLCPKGAEVTDAMCAGNVAMFEFMGVSVRPELVKAAYQENQLREDGVSFTIKQEFAPGLNPDDIAKGFAEAMDRMKPQDPEKPSGG